MTVEQYDQLIMLLFYAFHVLVFGISAIHGQQG